MNHGIICLGGEIVAATLWDMAMGCGRFVALYTARTFGDGHHTDHSGAAWDSAFVHSIGEPEVLDPEGFGRRPGFRHPTGEYARYEPAYDAQFRKMVELSQDHAFLSIAVPASVRDAEALRLLGEMYPALFRLRDRYWDRPHERRPRRERRLRDVIGLIAVREEWAFFISSFDRYTPCAIVLSDSQSVIAALAEAVAAARNRDHLVETW